MAVERIVRVIRGWDVVVLAEYGDTEETLLAKATPGTIAACTETKNLVLAPGETA